MGEVEEERLLLMLFDKLHRFVGQAISQILSLLFSLQRRILSPVGPEETARGTVMCSGDIHIKALGFGLVLFPTQMPFSDMAGGISRCFQRLRQGNFLQRQLMDIFRGQNGRIEAGTPADQKVGQLQAGGILAGHDTGAGG